MNMKRSIGEQIFDVFNIILMMLLGITMIYPYLNQLAVSLNDSRDTMWGGITIFPRKFTLDNYVHIFNFPTFINSLFISMSRVIIGTLFTLLVTVSSAYAMVKKNLPGRSFIISFLLVPMFIGGGLIPTYILFRYLGILNDYMVYILPGAFVFFNMVIVRTYLQSIPKEIEEAAVIDGANDIHILFKIMIPLAKPVIATISLWVAVAHWNDWTTSLLFVTSQELYPLQYVLMKVVKESEIIQQMIADQLRTGGGAKNSVPVTPEAVKAAILIVATVPIVTFYPFLQKYFVKGIMIGGVKE